MNDAQYQMQNGKNEKGGREVKRKDFSLSGLGSLEIF